MNTVLGRTFVGSLWLALVFLSGCSIEQPESPTTGQAMVDLDLLHTLPAEPISYRKQVQPVLERRCVVCHGCFDAPCQLKLSAYEGIIRGANKKKVYDGARIRAVQPSRLFIDVKTPAQWRRLGFSPVLNEGDLSDPLQNLETSVLYQMLRLKQLNPQPRTGMLPESFDLALDRKQVCPKPGEFDRFSREHPLWGMPYAMPNLEPDEYNVLVQWLAQGAPAPQARQPSPQAQAQIVEWERFLNRPGNKQRLVSRYLYEHLFHAHIHFAGAPQREFYRLIRSTTPSGIAPDEIPTVRPFDDPGTSSFYYRLVPYRMSIVAKAHLPYEFSPQRMARYRELFLKPDYVVTELPGYDQRVASNPFKSFAALPPDSRYRFLLDDARFFINGFIKGPVCRGQVALNVIDDQFWVVFFDPDRKLVTSDPVFLSEVADYLQMPAEWGNSTLKLLKPWTEYSKKQQAYRQARDAQLSSLEPMELDQALEYIWDGDGRNRNAALTVFRHFDSAAVEYGFVGDYPETAWMIDYPLFERIHYLLVAGFDVYGNVGHQLNTRLYMDFLRMEGEDNFLTFLPRDHRKAIRDSWYKGIRESQTDRMLKAPENWMTAEPVTGYRTDDPQLELYQHLEARLGPMSGPPDVLNRCTDDCDELFVRGVRGQVERELHRLTLLTGAKLRAVPDLTFVRIMTGDPDRDLAYSLVLNKGYKNLSSIFADEDRRDIDDDTLSVVRGFAGMYPNFFLIVDVADIEGFVDRFLAIRNRADYESFVAVYGVRRTNPQFWQYADWFGAKYAKLEPVEAGIFDLNRYRNR